MRAGQISSVKVSTVISKSWISFHCVRLVTVVSPEAMVSVNSRPRVSTNRRGGASHWQQDLRSRVSPVDFARDASATAAYRLSTR